MFIFGIPTYSWEYSLTAPEYYFQYNYESGDLYAITYAGSVIVSLSAISLSTDGLGREYFEVGAYRYTKGSTAYVEGGGAGFDNYYGVSRTTAGVQAPVEA